MFSSLGYEVIALERMSIGGLSLTDYDLPQGVFTELDLEEVSAMLFEA